MANRVAILILAAGGASRMNKPKQLLPFRGSTLLEQVLTTAQSTTAQKVMCVLGAHAQKIRTHIDVEKASICVHPQWSQGMGTSIGFGTQELLKESPNLSAILIALGDQPLLKADFFQRFIDKHSENPDQLVGTKYQSSIGVPALFPRKYFGRLAELKGDKGAKSLLEEGIAFESVEQCLMDIDTQEDYDSLLKNDLK